MNNIMYVQVKEYLSTGKFRLKFFQKGVTLCRFYMCCFSRKNFKWNPWLIMLFYMILDQLPNDTSSFGLVLLLG